MYRFAPSPTGDMHIGNLRVALFNFICATQESVGLNVRIEDTDKQRNIEGKDIEILEILEIFKIKHKPCVYQSHSLKFHHQFAAKLLSEKKAFSCFCTQDELCQKKELAKKESRAYRYDGTCKTLKDIEVLDNENPFVIRLKKPSQPISFTDTIKGKLSFEPDDIDDFVIMRQDKYPTYNFACAIDDMIGATTHIIRGEDHVSNTPKQILIHKYLGYEKKIKYTHLPIILNSENKKMSKRDDASSVMWLLNEGFLPQAISNYLILLGNKAPKEIFTLQEALSWFKLENISKSPAKFDINQLKYINKEHIKLLDELELASLLGYSSKDIGKLAKLYTQEASTIKELKLKIDTIFSKREFLEEIKDECCLIAKALKNAPMIDSYGEFKKYLISETALREDNFFQPLRFILTGSFHGPKLQDIYPLLKNLIKEIKI